MKKTTAFGVCTTFILLGLLSFVLAFCAEGENNKVSYDDNECEKYKMKAFKLGIASTAALLCIQLYVAYIFAGCCQCKEIGRDVNMSIQCFYILAWILAIIDFAILMDTSLKVKYRLEDKSPYENLCAATNSKQNFLTLGVISLVVAVMYIICFFLIYKWTKDPIPERNTLVNVVPNMWYIEEEEGYCMEQGTAMEIGRSGEVEIVRRVRLAVYWKRTVNRFTIGSNNVQGRIAPPPTSSPSREKTTTKRWVHSTVLLLVCVGASTFAFLAEVKSIKHSYLHGDCIEMNTAAYKLGFASGGLVLFSLVYFLAIVGCDAMKHYNGCNQLFFTLAWLMSAEIMIFTFAYAGYIKSRIDSHEPVKDICPIRKTHTLRIRAVGFSLNGVLTLVVLILELIVYNYLQVSPGP